MAVASRERIRSGSTTSSGSAQTFFELPVGGVQTPLLDLVGAGGGGRCKGATTGGCPRTFLIGVAGGTASGKVGLEMFDE